ncbi:MAG: tol-pal system protein YbgF [Gammaproteobacteria bacterium]|nr:tol-pal system protein YbgF [Gammaproteobacteria bacterium]
MTLGTKLWNESGYFAVTTCVLLSACASNLTPPPTQTAEVATETQAKSVEALIEMDNLREELAALRNEVEVQQNEIKRLRERQDDLYTDLDNRLRSREGVAGAGGYATGPTPGYAPGRPGYAPGPAPGYAPDGADLPGTPGYTGPAAGYGTPPPAYGATTEPQAPATEPTMPPVTDAAVPPADGAPPVVGQESGAPAVSNIPLGNTTAAPPPVPATRLDEQTAYDAAFELLKQSRYREAIDGFNDVLARYPAGSLADDSQYWIAEAWYVTRDFDSAMEGFRKIIDQYPASDRMPDAMLKIGYIHYETGDKIRARQALNEVVTRFPGSRVAISAETRLRRMEREGG